MKKNFIAAGVVLAIACILVVAEIIVEALRPVAGKIWLALIAACLVILMIVLTLHFARARDLGQWENTDPAISQWYRTLMQPDLPTMSCCGEADAYFADEIHVRNGNTFATITDDRPDEPRNRPHVPVGTEIEIPNNKLKWDRSNPTGHNIVFLSRDRGVWCFVQGGGV